MDLLQHLHSRHLDTDLHRVILDEDEGVAYLTLWDLSGNLTGFLNYRPDGDKNINNGWLGKYCTRVHRPCVSFWGLESWNSSRTLFVTEGVFDAARLTSRGYSAVASMSNALDLNRLSWLKTIEKVRPVIVVCDNDDAGTYLAKYFSKFEIVKGAKDLGEASDEYVTELLSNYE